VKHEDYNSFIRRVFRELIDDGYKKLQICNATLGSQRVAQFNHFMNDNDMGVKPHSRILNSLDYELHLVPIPKNNQEKLNVINELSDQFIQDLKFLLVEYLEDDVKMAQAKSKSRSKKFSEAIDKLTEQIF